MTTITTTIKREFLAAIIAGTKTIEYRERKPYWTERFKRISRPFRLRMINGMSKTAPEVTVLINHISVGLDTPYYECHIAKVLSYKNWNKKKGIPA